MLLFCRRRVIRLFPVEPMTTCRAAALAGSSESVRVGAGVGGAVVKLNAVLEATVPMASLETTKNRYVTPGLREVNVIWWLIVALPTYVVWTAVERDPEPWTTE